MLLSHYIIQSNLCPGLFFKCSEGSNLLSGCSCSSVLVTAFSSKVPLRYKKNAINGKLNRAKKIFSDFQSEIQLELKQSFWKLGFHIRSLETLSIISKMLTKKLWYQDGFLMKEKQLRSTDLFQTNMNIFKEICARI